MELAVLIQRGISAWDGRLESLSPSEKCGLEKAASYLPLASSIRMADGRRATWASAGPYRAPAKAAGA